MGEGTSKEKSPLEKNTPQEKKESEIKNRVGGNHLQGWIKATLHDKEQQLRGWKF